ncbi:transposable element Tcb2 transposase [Trichonephila clavipes]|nr:transposable element Tcb2 transposase [Trichonephila clavipes]
MCNCILPEKCQINIKFLVKLKKSVTKTLKISTEAYEEETLSRAHVFEWHKIFSGGRVSVEDDESAGCPNSTVRRVRKRWTDEHKTTRKTGSGRRKVTSARDDRHLLRMDVNDRTASSRKLAAHESHFNSWDHDGHIRVKRYAGESCLPEYVIEQHRGLASGVVVWGAISYHGRSNLLRIEDNLNSYRYVCEVIQPEVVPFLEGIPVGIFQQDNALPHVAKTVRDFCSAQHMQLLPWSAYSPDMSPTEHVRGLVGQRLVCDPRPAASKDELLLRLEAI